MTETSKNHQHHRKWGLFPFAGQIFTLALFVCLGPGAWGAYLLSHSNWIAGGLVLILWGVPFFKFIEFLNDRKVVRFVVSIPSTILILMAGLLL